MKKGWNEAYCSEGLITTHDGSADRLFKMKDGAGTSLMKRGKKMAMITKNCVSFDDMGAKNV
jgi:3-deoxy-D-manno-octulosonate 8-phosphate phosphatase KdsC-like HAD superfamily phosphatase